MGRPNGRPRKARLDLTDTTEVAEILQDLRELRVPWYRLSVRMGKRPNWLTKRCSEETLEKARDDEYHLLRVDDALLILEFVGTHLAETSDQDHPFLKAFLLGADQDQLAKIRADPRRYAPLEAVKVKRLRLRTVDSAPGDPKMRFGPVRPSREENPKLFEAAKRARLFLTYVRVRYDRLPEPDLTTAAGFIRSLQRLKG